MTTARQKVLTYMNKNRTASSREISRALKMSSATVRHHLRLLVSDGRLELETTRPRGSRGRPEKIYSVPRAALGDNLSALGDALLTVTGKKLKIDEVAAFLAGELDFSDQPITKRLNLVIGKMTEMNYHARWEAGAEGPRIHFGHCPYAAVVTKHPVLCDMDENLLSHLVSAPVLRESKPETQKGGCPFVFLIG